MDKSRFILYTLAVVLDRKIGDNSARVGVVGLGYVGLPLAIAFARRGFQVTGIEADARRAGALRRGRSYIEDVTSKEISSFIRSGALTIDGTGAGIGKLDAVLICVQTPLRKTKEPDISNIIAACRAVAKRLKSGTLVVLESTTYPGTTQEAVLPELEKSGLKAGRDFWLAFSPERVDPGNERWKIENTPKVVGGIDADSTRLAAALYSAVISKVVPVSSTMVPSLTL